MFAQKCSIEEVERASRKDRVMDKVCCYLFGNNFRERGKEMLTFSLLTCRTCESGIRAVRGLGVGFHGSFFLCVCLFFFPPVLSSPFCEVFISQRSFLRTSTVNLTLSNCCFFLRHDSPQSYFFIFLLCYLSV